MECAVILSDNFCLWLYSETLSFTHGLARYDYPLRVIVRLPMPYLHMHKYVLVAKIIIIIVIEHGLTYMFEKCRINESFYALTVFIIQKYSLQHRHYERTLRLKG